MSDITRDDIDEALIKDLKWLRTEAQRTEAWSGTTADEVTFLDMPEGKTADLLRDVGDVDRHDELLGYAEYRWAELDERPYCEDCGAIDTEHVDVQQVDDPGYGTASGKVDLCEHCRLTTYHVENRVGPELGKYDGTSPRDAVRRALLNLGGHTVYPDPDGDGLIGRHGQPVHIFCDYLVDGEIVEVRMLD